MISTEQERSVNYEAQRPECKISGLFYNIDSDMGNNKAWIFRLLSIRTESYVLLEKNTFLEKSIKMFLKFSIH